MFTGKDLDDLAHGARRQPASMGPGDVHREGRVSTEPGTPIFVTLQWGPVMFTGKDDGGGWADLL